MTASSDGPAVVGQRGVDERGQFPRTPLPAPVADDRPDRNTGHGHVWPRPDGHVARCGGPPLCRDCLSDLNLRRAAEEDADAGLRQAASTLREVRRLLTSAEPVKRARLLDLVDEAEMALPTPARDLT